MLLTRVILKSTKDLLSVYWNDSNTTTGIEDTQQHLHKNDNKEGVTMSTLIFNLTLFIYLQHSDGQRIFHYHKMSL